MKTLVFVLLSTVCTAQQTDQYTQILLSKKLGKEVKFYSNGYGIAINAESTEYGIVDSTGVITYTAPAKNEISHLYKDRFVVKIKDKDPKKENMALVDEKGRLLIPFDTHKINPSWSIKRRLIVSKNGKEGIYDYEGKEIIPYTDKIKFAGDNRFFVKKDNIWQIYDSEGKLKSDREFKENLHFYKNKVYIPKGERQGEIIDNDGVTLNTISNNNVDNIGGYPFLITKNPATSKYGIIDTQENRLADEMYDEVFLGTRYIYFIRNEKINIFSKEAKKIYSTDFDYVKSLFNDLFSTQKSLKNPKMAVIRIDGEIVIPKEYDNIEGIKIAGNNFIYLIKGNEQRLLDKNLEDVLEPGYQIEKIFPNGLIVKKEGVFYKFSVTDKKYEELKKVASIKENGIFYYPQNMFPAIVCKNYDNLYGIIDENGKEIVPFIYDDINAFLPDNEIVVQKEKKYGVTNYQNEPLKDVIYDRFSVDKDGIKLTKDKSIEYLNFTDSETDNKL